MIKYMLFGRASELRLGGRAKKPRIGLAAQPGEEEGVHWELQGGP